MKVKVTATISLETELYPEDYVDVVGLDIGSIDDIIDYEVQSILEEPYERLGAQLCAEGEVSNVRIEKMEATEAKPEAA